MIIRLLMRLLNNERIVNKLAESYPLRFAARWVVYFIQRSKSIAPNDPSLRDATKRVVDLTTAQLEERLKRIAQDLEQKLKK